MIYKIFIFIIKNKILILIFIKIHLIKNSDSYNLISYSICFCSSPPFALFSHTFSLPILHRQIHTKSLFFFKRVASLCNLIHTQKSFLFYTYKICSVGLSQWYPLDFFGFYQPHISKSYNRLVFFIPISIFCSNLRCMFGVIQF